MEKRLVERPLRIWVPGCSTGEEVYSVAIALLEFLGDRASNLHIQIFASDIDDKAIDKARQGIYPESVRDNIAPGRLQRFSSRPQAATRSVRPSEMSACSQCKT